MERVTLRIPKEQIEEIERIVDGGEYPNRSEAIRAAVRDMVKEKREERREQAKVERDKAWAQS